MKSTGILRKIDNLGRLVIPKELRKVVGIDNGEVEIFLEDDRIILSKHELACLFCGSSENVRLIKGKLICSDCLEELKQI